MQLPEDTLKILKSSLLIECVFKLLLLFVGIYRVKILNIYEYVLYQDLSWLKF